MANKGSNFINVDELQQIAETIDRECDLTAHRLNERLDQELTVRLGLSLYSNVVAESQERGCGYSKVVRQALIQYFYGKQPDQNTEQQAEQKN